MPAPRVLGFLASLALLTTGLASSSAARAGERWFDVDPTLDRVALVWKEGTIEARREVGRSLLRLTSDGSGRPALAALRPAASRVDTRGRFVKVLLRVEGMEHLAGLEIRLGSGGFATSWYAMSVPLYGDPEYNFVQDGEWSPLTLSFGEARSEGSPDRAAIDSIGIVVTDKGTGRVSVDFAGWAIVDEPPEGIVSFSFDDGYTEHLAAARKLAARGWRGTFYVIPELVGTKFHLSAAELAELGGMAEVAAHGDVPFTELPPGELPARIRAIQGYLIARGFAAGAGHVAYPLGKQEPRWVRPAVRQLFATARLAGAGPETIPPADPHLLRAFNVVDTTTPEEIGAAARRARVHHEWLILMFHYLPETAAKPTDFAMARFELALEEVARAQVRVASVGEVFERIAPPPMRATTPDPPHGPGPARPAP